MKPSHAFGWGEEEGKKTSKTPNPVLSTSEKGMSLVEATGEAD